MPKRSKKSYAAGRATYSTTGEPSRREWEECAARKIKEEKSESQPVKDEGSETAVCTVYIQETLEPGTGNGETESKSEDCAPLCEDECV
ncbi:hypothetical protein AAFF_G00362010 [Aldrovandia affinis]|uniref:Uncharacterized protein n=1 Tax=Aldrovandia affinis TaxID=143900 RepID=A0AAD7SHV7_9TELE|nr:hypothetical protein AAFF_G00362010 [Aldrovandia affinis]